MHAHAFEPAPGYVNVIIWKDRSKREKVQEKQFKTSGEAINWLADECDHLITSIKTEWYKNRPRPH